MPLSSSPFINTGAYPTRSGNHIWPWIDGEPAFRRICEAIEAAQQSVWATVDNFTLCGIAGLGVDGRRKPVYVHSKLMLVDDAWATVGSCNLYHYSLFGNGELNVAFWDPAVVRAMRVALFQEHLATDTSEMNDTGALRLFRRIARENRQRHQRSDPNWQGLAFSLDVVGYGQEPQF